MTMSSVETMHDVEALQHQLSLARTEIHNLRREIKSIKLIQSKEIAHIYVKLENWRCPACKINGNSDSETAEPTLPSLPMQEKNRTRESGGLSDISSIEFTPIGYISTGFTRKRAVPRQPNLNINSQGMVTLYNHIFSNPEHSLDGLDGFSHMWILFHFHNNQSNHVRAKVAPPRLNGARVGVFGTRSPHRPSPIGLSLVHIDSIKGRSIYFSGVDMLDGTPVLDLKPYIPRYDDPSEPVPSEVVETEAVGAMERLELDGQESDSEGDGAGASCPVVTFLHPPPPQPEREAPDGQEGAARCGGVSPPSPLPVNRQVRVPQWISQSGLLQVTFTPQSESFLSSLPDRNVSRVIADILREDPRSIYLRDRYSNQFYTFLINNYHVSCKFDDDGRIVKVFRVIPADTLCDCGKPQWQCSEHSGSVDS